MPAINPKNKQTKYSRNRKRICQNEKRREINKPKVSRVRNIHKSIKKLFDSGSVTIKEFLPLILKYEKFGKKSSGSGLRGRKNKKIVSRNLSHFWSRFRKALGMDVDQKSNPKAQQKSESSL